MHRNIANSPLALNYSWLLLICWVVLGPTSVLAIGSAYDESRPSNNQSVDTNEIYAQADKGEREARRYFLKAAQLTSSKNCRDTDKVLSPFSLIMDKSAFDLAMAEGIFVDQLSEEQFKTYLACLRDRRKAAVIHQRILSDFFDTEPAFELAKKLPRTPADFDRMISKANAARKDALERKQRMRSLFSNSPNTQINLESLRQAAKERERIRSEMNRILNPQKELEQPRKLATKPYAPPLSLQNSESGSLAAMVKRQLAPCWSIPVIVKDGQAIEVGVQIRLNKDGSLKGAPRVLDGVRMKTDRSFRVIAESALRALNNPSCRPLKLPSDQYEIWKNITFNFDPGEVIAR